MTGFDPPVHGGGLAAAMRRWGPHEQGWLDLSTGINPFIYPLTALDPAIWHRLPDRDAFAQAEMAARRCYGADEACPIVAAGGSQALIGLLPSLVERSQVIIVGPTYAEHAYRWRLAGHEVTEVGALPEAQGKTVVVLANPNNPDGRVASPDRLAGMAERLGRQGGLLVVDEAFADTDPSISLAPLAGMRGLLVLRSFGKFFGLAGLRLGFALGEAALIGRLARTLGPWAVSGPALAIGARALADEGWITSMRAWLAREGAAFDTHLRGLGLDVAGNTPLFRLVRHENAAELADGLGRAGILVRHFNERPDWLRVGLPQDTDDAERVIRTLAPLLKRETLDQP